jgi:hypothetical protein
MSNKTPPLVIPVVVDASGVQAGLNNVNNRLRNGVAGSAAGAAGGNFGSGGGGAVAGALVGAAVGMYGASKGQSQAAYSSTPRARGLLPLMGVQSGRFAGGGMSPRYRDLKGQATGWQAFGDLTPEQSAANVAELYRQRSAQRALQAHETRRRNRLMMRAYRNQALSDIGAYKDFAAGFGGAMARTAVVAGTAVYAGKKIYDLANKIGAAGSDLSGLVGSTSYGKMRNVALREFDRPKNASPIQSMLLGAMKMTGGRETALEKDAAAIRKGVSGFFGAAGAAYETFRSDPGYALLLAFQATPMGGLLSGMFGGSFKESIKTEIAYRNWKAAGN